MAVPTRSAEAPRSSTNEGSAEAPVPSTSESTLQPLHGNPAGYGLSAALGRSAESTTDIATVCVMFCFWGASSAFCDGKRSYETNVCPDSVRTGVRLCVRTAGRTW